MSRREALEKTLAAVVLAVAGGALAWFVWPQMHLSDSLLREGVRAEATVVALDAHSCSSSSYRSNRSYPCFRATGSWIHAGVAYRTTLGFYKNADEVPLGTAVPIIFMPSPAAAAGLADLSARVIGEGRTLPVSERPVYLGLLALAGLLCAPLLTLLFKASRLLARSGGPRPGSAHRERHPRG